MARVTVEDCVDKITSRFELVLIASQRARNLHTGDMPTVEKENDKNTVIALREIADESIELDILKDNLIKEFQLITPTENEENIESTEEKEETDINKNEIENEIKELTSAEDEKLEEQYEILDSDKIADENIISDNHENIEE